MADVFFTDKVYGKKQKVIDPLEYHENKMIIIFIRNGGRTKQYGD